MDYDQSNNEAKRSELNIDLPPQHYGLPKHVDGLKLESNVSDQGFLDSEPSSKSPAQEHIFPRSREGQKSPVAMSDHRLISHDHERTALPFTQSPIFCPVNRVSEECSYGPQWDGSGQESKEQSPTAGFSNSQQPQTRKVNGSLEYSWRESNIARTGDSSAMGSSSVDDQRRAGAEIRYRRNHLKAGQPVLDQGPRNKAPGTTFDTLSHRIPSSQMTDLPLPEMSGPHRNQELGLPPVDSPSLSSIAEFDEQASRWRLRPNYQWFGFLPDIYETRRLEWRTGDGRPGLIQGPTPHLGPPLKPFDDARSEEMAIEQWRRVVRGREILEAGGL